MNKSWIWPGGQETEPLEVFRPEPYEAHVGGENPGRQAVGEGNG